MIAQDLVETGPLDHLDHRPGLRLRFRKGAFVQFGRGLGAEIVQSVPAACPEIPVQVDAGGGILPLVQIPDIFVGIVKQSPGRPALKNVVHRILHLLRLHAVHAVLGNGDAVGVDHGQHVEAYVLKHLVPAVPAVQKILHLAHDDGRDHIFSSVHGGDHQDLLRRRRISDDGVPEFPPVGALSHGAAVEAGNTLQAVQVRCQLIIGVHAGTVEIVASDLVRRSPRLVLGYTLVGLDRRRSRTGAVQCRIREEIGSCKAGQYSCRHCRKHGDCRNHKRAYGRRQGCRLPRIFSDRHFLPHLAFLWNLHESVYLTRAAKSRGNILR